MVSGKVNEEEASLGGGGEGEVGGEAEGVHHLGSKVAVLVRVGVQEPEELIPCRPEKVSGEDGDRDDWGLEDGTASHDEDVDGEDVDHDGAEDEESEISGERNRDQQASEDFEHFHKGKKSGGSDRSKKEGRWRTLGWSVTHGDEVEPVVDAKE